MDPPIFQTYRPAVRHQRKNQDSVILTSIVSAGAPSPPTNSSVRLLSFLRHLFFSGHVTEDHRQHPIELLLEGWSKPDGLDGNSANPA